MGYATAWAPALQVRVLAKLRGVEPDFLFPFSNVHARDFVDHPQGCKGNEEGIDCRPESRGGLSAKEGPAAAKRAVESRRVHRQASEHTEAEDAEHTANAMDPPDVEGVIPVQPVLQSDGQVAYESRENADNDGRAGSHVAGRRGNGGQPGQWTP